MFNMPTTLTIDDLRFNPPSFRYSVMAEFLEARYGVGGDMKSLEGERDQNTRVVTATGVAYVLKIAGPDEGFDLVDLQIKALEHIRATDPTLPVPQHIRTLDGELSTVIKDETGVPHYVRLLTYVAGTPMDAVEPPSDEQIIEIGSLTARICVAMKAFKHPAAKLFMPWDIMNGLVICDEFRDKYILPDLTDRCAPHLDRLRDVSLPMMAKLPTQVVHNDAHLGNLLTDPARANSVVGVIDFGDVVDRPLVVDHSSTLASIIEMNADVTGCSRLILEGFEAHCAVSDEEVSLLYDALFARLALSVQLFQFRLLEVSHDEEIKRFYLPQVTQALNNLLATDRSRYTSTLMRGR